MSANLTKTKKTLLESFGTMCYVLLLSGTWLEDFFHHLPVNTKTYSFEYQNFQEAKTKKNPMGYTLCFYCALKYKAYFFYVFAFTDFTAWNATVGIDGEWRKLVYRQSPSMSSGYLEKIGISKRVFDVFVKKKTQGYTGEPNLFPS